MAIQKKIQLYVSDTTGATKTAKYYRIPLPADALPYDILDNPLKGIVRLYCRIVGDRFELAPVVRQVTAGITPLQYLPDGAQVATVFAEECSPVIPKELLNDGESYSKYYNLTLSDSDERVEFDTVSFFGTTNFTLPGIDATIKDRLKYLGDNKSKLFSKGNPIYSDTYTDLTQFVPSTWQEFDSYEDVLTDIRTWIDAPDIVENRVPDYPTTIVNSPRLKYIIKEVCTISGNMVDGEVKSGETVVTSGAASDIYREYMERIKLDNPTIQGDILTIECNNYYANDVNSGAKMSVFGKKANGDVVEFSSTVETNGTSRTFKAIINNVSEFTEILFHLYTRSNGGQNNNTTVKFTI